MNIQRLAQRTFEIEMQGLKVVSEKIGGSFGRAITILSQRKGRVVVTGMGKSGLIGRKIAATLSSTGTPALFLHPGDAAHGDLGVVVESDVVIILSSSGETEEILELVPHFRKISCKLILLTGQVNSSLAGRSDVVLDVGVPREACRYNLAPTASTTALLVMGDALGLSLSDLSNHTEKDFAATHPRGELGRRTWPVSEVMRKKIPSAPDSTRMRDALAEMSRKQMWFLCVTDDKGRLIGTISETELKKAIRKVRNFLDLQASCVMNTGYYSVREDDPAAVAAKLYRIHRNRIRFVPVVNNQNRPVGLVTLEDLVKTRVASR